MTKAELRAELLRLLHADLEAAERAQQTTHEGATHEEAKPENDKDTRALEQSYLARGQARRVEELRADVGLVVQMPIRDLQPGERIALGAIVTLDEDGAKSVVFIAPARGGTELGADRIKVVTPSSPLGRALIGKVEGDDCEVRVAARTRAIVIDRVS